ncbi:MAG: T9SS type A sorting domain-containing protein [Bacteroidetes bacterium]|nr:T9SS type A sorting domain-containing protein [Bacteroidota bacterium]
MIKSSMLKVQIDDFNIANFVQSNRELLYSIYVVIIWQALLSHSVYDPIKLLPFMKLRNILLFFCLIYGIGSFGQDSAVFKLPYELLDIETGVSGVSGWSFPGNPSPRPVMADLDADGDGDIVLHTGSDDSVSAIIVEWHTSPGVFTPDTILYIDELDLLEITNVNGDAYLDIIYSAMDTMLYYMPGDTSGFGPPESILFGIHRKTVHFNTDQKADFIYSLNDTVFIAISDSSGYEERFIDVHDSLTYQWVFNSLDAAGDLIDVGDLNMDGWQDITYVNNNDRIVTIFGDSLGNFADRRVDTLSLMELNVCGIQNPYYLKIIDGNKDGINELNLVIDYNYCSACSGLYYEYLYYGHAYQYSGLGEWTYAYRIQFPNDYKPLELTWVEQDSGYSIYFIYNPAISYTTFGIGMYDIVDDKMNFILNGANGSIRAGGLYADNDTSLYFLRAFYEQFEFPLSEWKLGRLSLQDPLRPLDHHISTMHYLRADNFGINAPIRVVDLNGDPYPDILALENARMQQTIIGAPIGGSRQLFSEYLNDGSGSFTRKETNLEDFPYVHSNYTQRIHDNRFFVSDLNLDGITDMIMTLGSRHVRTYIGDGAGNYAIGQTILQEREQGQSYEIAVGDMDQDGWDDLIIGDTLYVNDQTGDLIQSSTLLYPNIADINGDGLPDTYQVHPDSNLLQKYINNGNLSFSYSEISLDGDYQRYNNPPPYVLMNDMNGDSLADMITATNYDSWYSSDCLWGASEDIQINLQDSLGNFTLTSDVRIGYQDGTFNLPFRSFLTWDSGDNERRLLLYHYTGNHSGSGFYAYQSINYVTLDTAYMYTNSGPIPDYQLGLVPAGFADMDLDGDLDMLTYNNTLVGYLENTSDEMIVSVPENYASQSGTELSVYPNPISAGTQLRIKLREAQLQGRCTMQLINVNGQTVYNERREEFPNEITLPVLDPGIFILHITMDSGIILNFKIVLF